jgi:hypothetical protein
MKGSGGLALMVALAEPPLGALLMAPNPFAMWFINLVVSWFCVMGVFFLFDHKHTKGMHKSQKLFGQFLHL